jgi:hypothetical protein
MNKDDILYRSGDLFFPREIRRFLETFLIGSYQSTIYITYWSVLHFISGVLTYILLTTYIPNIKHPYSVGFVIHTLWELWQVYIGSSKPWNWAGHNGLTDFLMDTLLFILGMYVSSFFMKTTHPL